MTRQRSTEEENDDFWLISKKDSMYDEKFIIIQCSMMCGLKYIIIGNEVESSKSN